MHLPPLHEPPSQTLPHAPQWFGFLFRSTHTPLPSQSGRSSVHVHTELSQTAPVWQALPQSPQFARSRVTFVHAPLQSFAGAVQLHVPVVQSVPPVHESPQLPQLSSFDCVSTQADAQFVSEPQLDEHSPALQTCPALHFVWQAPQNCGLLVRSTHVPLQFVRPSGQTQAASEQTKPSGHFFPQPPQLSGSVVRRTHSPPQSTLPLELPASLPLGLQLPAVHAPSRQTSPFAHFVPHAPQFSRSARMLVHWPLHSSCPAGQPQAPFKHSWLFAQTVPHAPQWFSLLFVSTQELLQFVRPVAQPAAHAPWLQTPSVLVQVVPHCPQFFGSFVRSTHVPLQLVVPVGQPHDPKLHCSVAPHALSHAPQWSSSLAGSTQDAPHCVRPAAHVAEHCPRLQTSPAAHFVPHSPQLDGSVSGLVQASPHFTLSPVHVAGPVLPSGVASATDESGGVVVLSLPASAAMSLSTSPPHAGTPTAAATAPTAIIVANRSK